MPAKKNRRAREIRDYDERDTTKMVDRDRPLRYEDLGIELPATPTRHSLRRRRRTNAA